MKKFCLSVVILIFLISGCMSQQARLDSGIQSFQRQDFYQAFQRLKSLANAGNPDAEYALGYMYYYGQGVIEDKQLAILWMTSAAKQNHLLAIQALHVLAQEPISRKS